MLATGLDWQTALPTAVHVKPKFIEVSSINLQSTVIGAPKNPHKVERINERIKLVEELIMNLFKLVDDWDPKRVANAGLRSDLIFVSNFTSLNLRVLFSAYLRNFVEFYTLKRESISYEKPRKLRNVTKNHEFCRNKFLEGIFNFSI